MPSNASAELESVGIPVERIDSRVLLIRGHKVLLDADLAELYGVTTGALNQAVKRNGERFPADFMFQLAEAETGALLRSQIVTSSQESEDNSLEGSEILKSQSVISKRTTSRRGGSPHRPNAFTKQGVATLSSVLRSSRAIAVNIEIMRAFVRLRQLIASSAKLARKLAALEQKYDEQFKVVFDAIRELMSPAMLAGRGREMGFHTGILALHAKRNRSRKQAAA